MILRGASCFPLQIDSNTKLRRFHSRHLNFGLFISTHACSSEYNFGKATAVKQGQPQRRSSTPPRAKTGRTGSGFLVVGQRRHRAVSIVVQLRCLS